MKSPLDNMIVKYLDKKSDLATGEKIAALVKEFKIPQAVASEWVEKRYPQFKENLERLDPRKAVKRNSHDY